MKTLEEIRDELAREYVKVAHGHVSAALHYGLQTEFKDGFDAAVKLMSEREKILVEALEPLLAWAKKNHEMPNYSEVILNAENALKERE